MAVELDISPRTIVTIEKGGRVGNKVWSKTLDYFLHSNENSSGDENLIQMHLDGSRKGASKNFGLVEADSIENDMDQILKQEYEGHYPFFDLVDDPYNQDEEPRLPREDDYITLRKKAYPITLDSEEFSIFLSSNLNPWWITSFPEASIETYEAIKNFSNVIDKPREPVQQSYKNLSDLTKYLDVKEELIKAFIRINEEGYTIFLGEQKLNYSLGQILFIDDLDISYINYEVASVHPRFMGREIPYYSYLSCSPPVLEKKPVEFMIGEMIDVRDDGAPIIYPTCEEEKNWCILSKSILADFSDVERMEYDNFVNKSEFYYP